MSDFFKFLKITSKFPSLFFKRQFRTERTLWNLLSKSNFASRGFQPWILHSPPLKQTWPWGAGSLIVALIRRSKWTRSTTLVSVPWRVPQLWILWETSLHSLSLHIGSAVLRRAAALNTLRNQSAFSRFAHWICSNPTCYSTEYPEKPVRILSVCTLDLQYSEVRQHRIPWGGRAALGTLDIQIDHPSAADTVDTINCFCFQLPGFLIDPILFVSLVFFMVNLPGNLISLLLTCLVATIVLNTSAALGK